MGNLENVGVDRIGCAWLILRDIDQQAEFIFIPRGAQIPSDAEPYDIPDVVVLAPRRTLFVPRIA